MNRPRIILGAIVVIAIAAVALDWTFWSRWMTVRDETAVSYPAWVDPVATVAGDFRGPLPVVNPDAVVLSRQAIVDLTAYAERVESFALLVHQGPGIQLETYWRGFGLDDVTETYSMAKSVLGLMFGFAIEQGFIRSLDDPITRYVPEWSGPDREAVTLRHVMQMASGLEHYRFKYGLAQSPYNKALRLFIGANMEAAILRFGFEGEPGNFHYNSANSQLLMLILQRATGSTYADFVSENLWRRLGAKPARVWMDRAGGMAKAYSFFQARPRDWLRIGLAIKNSGMVNGEQVIPENWLKLMASPSPANPKYGLHLWIGSPHVTERFYNKNTPVGVKQAEPFLVDDVVFFDGGGGQRVYIIPSADLVIVRTGMRSPAWDDGVIPNIVLRDLGFGRPVGGARVSLDFE
jgi:CubicO group peptidase (beta-lactamase class C family)